MLRLLFIVVCCGVGYANAAAIAGTIVVSLGGAAVTVVTTPDHDAAIEARVAEINVQITSQNAPNAAFNAANPRGPQKAISPLMTPEQFVADQALAHLNDAVKRDDFALIDKAKSGATLTDSEAARVKGALGIK